MIRRRLETRRREERSQEQEKRFDEKKWDRRHKSGVAVYSNERSKQ
jgi:hypothetical protein